MLYHMHICIAEKGCLRKGLGDIRLIYTCAEGAAIRVNFLPDGAKGKIIMWGQFLGHLWPNIGCAWLFGQIQICVYLILK